MFSGGLLLKDSGRIGEVVASRFYIRSMDLSGNTPWLRTFHLSPFQAAVYGAGCWAKQPLAVSARGVACSVSGYILFLSGLRMTSLMRNFRRYRRRRIYYPVSACKVHWRCRV